MLNILEDIMESDAVERLGTTTSKTLDVIDNTLDLINNEIKSYKIDQEIELGIKESDNYKNKKEQLLLLEIDESIARSTERIERRRARRTKGVNNDAQ